MRSFPDPFLCRRVAGEFEIPPDRHSMVFVFSVQNSRARAISIECQRAGAGIQRCASLLMMHIEESLLRYYRIAAGGQHVDS